ncbi:hypothetical protein [Acinetobacter haemolyticus]|uniref:Uncharacterized protein n=1 Tax=Acinetobacter haemolyticus TaxID=29430 RepID=A0A4P7B327_ACIHA|nr:hypothetical protein [Acinetobacter haemolyticus]QBQ15591.1 hypothetical protein AHTJR_04585 [Acinetobacter haemolyticus]
MNDFNVVLIILFSLIAAIVIYMVWAFNDEPSPTQIKSICLNTFNSGISTPFQRIGLIILIIGIFSFVSWFFRSAMDLEDIFNTHYFPDRRDFIFFHLYLYFLPLGFLMTWGYPIIEKIKKWIINDKNLDKDFITFEKRADLTNFVRKLGFGEKRDKRYMCGYVSTVLTPEKSREEALNLGLINEDDSHVLHVDVLLITSRGDELIFAPCNSLIADLKTGDFVLIAVYKNSLFSDDSWHYTLDAKLRPVYNKKGTGWLIEQDYRY